MYGPKGPFLLICTRMWTRCGHCAILGQVVCWVELPVQGDSARFSLNLES